MLENLQQLGFIGRKWRFHSKGEGANVLWLFEFIKNHIWFIKYFKIKENWFQFSEKFHNQ
jgi:hypothetical protein